MMITMLFKFILAISSFGNSLLIAKHQFVVVEAGSEVVIQLKHYDNTDASTILPTKLTFTIESIPKNGKLYQLSHVFSNYGYEPKVGTYISSAATNVTGSQNRIIYKRPIPDSALNQQQKWDSFRFSVFNGETKTTEYGIITLTAPSGIIVGSDFMLSSEGWTITGNHGVTSNVLYQPYSRGALNHYILNSNDEQNLKSTGDASLWYFNAPSSFTGNHGIAYGGILRFTIGAFSGDFEGTSNDKMSSRPVVIMKCDTCIGPVSTGIKLVYPLSALTTSFTGDTTTIEISLMESKGWLKDSQNTLVPYLTASQCDLIQVLSRLSSIQILGDYTDSHEAVGLDSVSLSNIASNNDRIPVCAQRRSDASECSC